MLEVNGKYAKTDLGKICFKNNLSEINILQFEDQINNKIGELKKSNEIISDCKTLIACICDIFFMVSEDEKIKRFEYSETRNFYTMFLNWRITKTSLNKMIMEFVNYWKSLPVLNIEKIVYVGKWGDLKRDGFKKLWTNIINKTDSELINLAIFRIKEEQDFIDNTLIKYVEVLYDLNLIDCVFYQKLKYGDDDLKYIILINNGFSGGLASLILDKYSNYLDFDLNDETVTINDNLIDKMILQDINGIYISELKRLI